MLPKQHRLTKNKDFQRVFKRGKYVPISRESLYVKFSKNISPFSRFGFVVSSKVSNKASRRNKIKRILREVVKNKLPLIKPGFDIIIVAKKGIEKKSFEDLSSIIDSVFKKIN